MLISSVHEDSCKLKLVTNDGQTSNGVAFELTQVVAAAPVEDGKQEPKAEHELSGSRLVLVLAQRVIFEECLLQCVRELPHQPLPSGTSHLVQGWPAHQVVVACRRQTCNFHLLASPFIGNRMTHGRFTSVTQLNTRNQLFPAMAGGRETSLHRRQWQLYVRHLTRATVNIAGEATTFDLSG